VIDQALAADARRGRGETFRVGDRVALRATGQVGEVRATDPATMRVLIAVDGAPVRWLSRLRLNPL